VLSTLENHLIAQLPDTDRRRLISLCEPVTLKPDEVLGQQGKRLQHVYFPTDGAIALFSHVDCGPVVELAMVGAEGMLGAHLVLGVSAAHLDAQVQCAGTSWRLGLRNFKMELAHSVALKRCISRYLYVLMIQSALSAACLHFHLLGPRLAGWLLMSQDRSPERSFYVTHELLAHLLGVRRVGVTVAASAFQRAGLISYRRGHMTVLDRAGLEAAACTCYKAHRQTYKDMFHPRTMRV
jgi:CRP-like cAMP-binding protein